MLSFVLVNGFLIMISSLYVVSKGRKLSKNIFSIVAFTLLFWFILGKGFTTYLTKSDVDYSVVEVKANELKITEDYEIEFKENTYLHEFPLSDVDIKFTDKYEKPTYVLNLEYVNNWMVRSIVGKEKVNPEVILFMPVEEVHPK